MARNNLVKHRHVYVTDKSEQRFCVIMEPFLSSNVISCHKYGQFKIIIMHDKYAIINVILSAKLSLTGH